MRWKVLAALGLGLVFYSAADILLWQRIFEASGLGRYDQQYHAGEMVVLGGMIVIGSVLLLPHGLWALWYALAFITLAFSGLEDALYYLLDGRTIPGSLPWLDTDPLIPFKPVTRDGLLLSATLWLLLWVVSFVGLRLAGRRCTAATRGAGARATAPASPSGARRPPGRGGQPPRAPGSPHA